MKRAKPKKEREPVAPATPPGVGRKLVRSPGPRRGPLPAHVVFHGRYCFAPRVWLPCYDAPLSDAGGSLALRPARCRGLEPRALRARTLVRRGRYDGCAPLPAQVAVGELVRGHWPGHAIAALRKPRPLPLGALALAGLA